MHDAIKKYNVFEKRLVLMIKTVGPRVKQPLPSGVEWPSTCYTLILPIKKYKSPAM